MRASTLSAWAGLAAVALGAAAHAAPQYQIIDLGLVDPSDIASQGFGISSGGVAYGRSIGVSNQAFTWTLGGGLVALDNLTTRTYHVAYDANDAGQTVGIGTTTAFGSSPLPVLWNGTTATELALPSGETLGRAWGINNSGVVCGSVDGGISEIATYWDAGGTAHVITATTSGGAYMNTAYKINDSGMIVGTGIDPNNAARNVALMYDTNTGTMMEIPSLAGDNGGLAFDISGGYVVGSSSFNQSGSRSFIWDATNGTVEIPLPAGASTASARGVNASGWVVGTGSGLYALPFLYDGANTYNVQDLIVAGGAGWDLSTNTSSSALGISDDGTIVGAGVFNGDVHAYAMVLVPTPGTLGVIGLGGVVAARRRRR